ncbi:MAG: tyrosine--tRNA ligase [Crenarchaeota archaeon]|nr:tyrosine--tRNA ligase [Thermoproteota archaeon]
MDVEERLKLITRNVAEVVTLDELREKLESGERLKAYLGFEPSGLFHLGWMIWALKVRDLVRAGVEFTLLVGSWHAWINDKFGGDMTLIRKAARHVLQVLDALGVGPGVIRVVDAEDLVSDKDYWATVLRVAKSSTLARIKRALTIMGRRAEEGEMDFSKLIYPAMQAADIFYLDVDIALGGTDQRKVHMLARDVARKLGRKKVIALHTPLLTGLQGASKLKRVEGLDEDTIAIELKMSKSKPETCIFVHDPPEAIARKIRAAYCPARVVEYNPVMEIARYILFAQPGFKLVVERPEKYGGTVVFESYEELEKTYKEGKLHPLDLKNAVAKALAEFLKPVRERLLGDPEARAIIEELEKAQVKRR